jgi:hypothetical protein
VRPARLTTDVIGGRVDLNPVGRALLLQALPSVAHVRASAAAATNLRGSLDRLFDEVAGNRMGSAFAIRQYGQLLLLEVLRAAGARRARASHAGRSGGHVEDGLANDAAPLETSMRLRHLVEGKTASTRVGSCRSRSAEVRSQVLQ